MNKLYRSLVVPVCVVLSVCLFFAWGCKPSDPGHLNPNQDPVVHLANVPLDDPSATPDSAHFTKSPLVQLYWVGNDGDGFVVAYMYRWSFKDSNTSTTIRYRPWTSILSRVVFDSLVIVVDVDSEQTPWAAGKLVRYFSNIDADPNKLSPASPLYDPAVASLRDHLNRGDTVTVLGYRMHASNPSVNKYPVHTSPNSGTFIFESNDFYNRHQFDIYAFDNEGAKSRLDSIRFWNHSVEPPRIKIASSPKATDTVFVLSNVTYTWPGIILTFLGTDKNSRTIEYSWHLDNQPWSDWSLDPRAVVTSSAMDTPYTGSHLFTVRARNEFGSMTPPDSQPHTSFFTVFPNFAKPDFPPRVLLVHESRGSVIDTPPFPSTDRLSNYYTGIFDSLGVPYDLWVTHVKGQPKAIDLANYSTIYMFADVLPFTGTDIQKMVIRAPIYGIYMDVGGSMITNGFPWPTFLQFMQSPESLLVRHMSVASLLPPLYVTNRTYDFLGALGNHQLGYPDVHLDTTKLDTSWHGALKYISICRPQGFGEVIYRYHSKYNIYHDPFDTSFVVAFEGQPLGLRYLGITYKSVFLGFPLYFCNQDEAIGVLRKALQDVGYH